MNLKSTYSPIKRDQDMGLVREGGQFGSHHKPESVKESGSKRKIQKTK